MKNFKILKKLIVIMLSVVLVLVCSNTVLAVDDDPFVSINTTNTNDTGGLTSTDNTNNTNNTNSTNNTNTAPLTSNTTNNTNSTRNASNINTLANTGLSNTNGIIALIVVVCGVSAIYSYKKVNDYKKL